MMAGLGNPRPLTNTCGWALCAPWRIAGTWFAMPIRESAQSSILMAELKLRRRLASVQFWTELHGSGPTVRFTRNTATFSLMRMYWLLSYCSSGGRMLEELIERFNQLKTRSED